MTTETASAAVERAPALEGQTVIVLGGSAGIGLETARSARLEGADVVNTGRDPDRLELAAKALQSLDNALLVPMRLARQLGSRVRPGGSLLFVGGTGGRHTALGLNARRDQLRETLPIGRVVGPEDVAALAVQVMSNTALTGATSTSTAASSSQPRHGGNAMSDSWTHVKLERRRPQARRSCNER